MQALFSDYEDLRQSGLFDPDYYLDTYLDVADRNLDPLVHYLEEGASEGRNPGPDFDTAFYLEQCREKGEQPPNPLLHYLRVGQARGFETKPSGREVRRPAQASEAPVKPPILVAIESLGATGDVAGRSRFSVAGWALAANPIAEITVSVDGEPAGTATYGLDRPDIARLYPDRSGAARCGFILAFDLPPGTGGEVAPLLTIRTTDGETGHRPLRVVIPPQQVDDAGGQADNTAGGGLAPMELYIDDAAVDASGILRVSGWVVCLVQIESVEAFVGDTAIGTAEFGRVRTDVERLRPDYPNARFAGFTLATDIRGVSAGSHALMIRATARSGISREAATLIEIAGQFLSAEPDRDAGFQHHTDEITLTAAGRLRIRGWAVCPSPLASLTVLMDNTELGDATIGLERPDVGNLFPALPHARRPGFVFDHDTGASAHGEHRVTLRLARQDGQIHIAAATVVAGAAEVPAAAAGTGGDPDCRLQIDMPHIIDGVAASPVRANLEIGGWALARAGVAAIEIGLDGKQIATADYGLRRLDIRAAFPNWENSLSSGFSVLLPHRLLPVGDHTLSVTLRDKAGGANRGEFHIVVEPLPEAAGPWSLRRKMPRTEIDLGLRIAAQRGEPPVFTAFMPVSAAAASGESLLRTLTSLRRQAYPNWRLLLLPTDDAARSSIDNALAKAGGLDDRIQIGTQADVWGLPAGANFLTVLSAGDELGCDAFLEMAIAAAIHPGADFLYSDERCLNAGTGEIGAFFKPQWSPDLLLSTNYVGRLWCTRTEVLRAASDITSALLDHGEYDLVLRCTEAARNIRHIPAVLCERAAEAPVDTGTDRAALERAMTRRGIAGEVAAGETDDSLRIKRTVVRPGLVSIVIPTCAADGLIERCIATLREITAYRDFEIVCIENIPATDHKWRDWLQQHADRVISTTEPFNWARFNNLAVAATHGEYLLFLNDDIEIDDPAWLEGLLEQAQRPEVGAVGPCLLYPDGRVQHAGMFLADPGQARHAFRYAESDDPGYFGLALTLRNVIAVTGACLMTRRETFDRLGGFDETQSIINNDLDFCLRAWRNGLVNIYTPHVVLTHHEAISRAGLDDVYDEAVFDGKWRDVFRAGDPYFSPYLSKWQDDFSVDHEPTKVMATGRPVYGRDEIRKILVVKLDHIGDCVIALPAVRRLKRHFPDATITVLTSNSSRPVWSLEPCVDETITFDFFHARSGLGELEHSEEDWRQLEERLVPAQFDLAIDLRKHLETRPALQHSGARYLAGFDYRSQFPWLDIALEAEADQAYARKRQHNGDDLIRLVEAVAAAGGDDRRAIQIRPAAAPAFDALRQTVGLDKRLVCVHPTVGNDARQWPAEYFAAVIDRLVTEDDAHVVLIGGPGDEDTADTIMRQVRRPEAVTSLIGKVPLGDLPGLLAGMSLFVGNNSGPKHIAAGLGVPTVGVHSGTEDVLEWGPVGPSALAVAREVACSPCYLAFAADCRRGLACLRQLEPARVYEACKRLLLLAADDEAADDTKPAHSATAT